MKVPTTGEIITNEDGSKVALLHSANSYGDSFWYFGSVADHTEDGEVLRTRDEALECAKRRGLVK